MQVHMNPTNTIIERLGLEQNGRVHKFFTNECAKAMDKYVPFRKGTLANTVIQGGQPTANVTESTITYSQPYAKVVYYGLRKGKQITIHTDMHSLATTYWDKHMWTAKGQDITKSVEEYIKSGGKNGI